MRYQITIFLPFHNHPFVSTKGAYRKGRRWYIKMNELNPIDMKGLASTYASMQTIMDLHWQG